MKKPILYLGFLLGVLFPADLAPSRLTAAAEMGTFFSLCLYAEADSSESPRKSMELAKKHLNPPSCDTVVESYRKDCLKSCERYQQVRKSQCVAGCNDPNQLRLRRIQCQESRRT